MEQNDGGYVDSSSRNVASLFLESDNVDSLLSKSEYLTREELIKRRASRLKRLAKVYGDFYWMLMEDVRRKHRDFVWKYGANSDDYYGVENGDNGVVFDGSVNNRDNCGGDGSNNGKLGLGLGLGFKRCVFRECQSKAMAMTNYCVNHILLDEKQVLYKRCSHMAKLQPGHEYSFDKLISCPKAILRSTVPELCETHMKNTVQSIRRELKARGVSPAVSYKLGTKFHVILAEYIRQIQTKRKSRRALNLASKNNGHIAPQA